MQAGCGAVTVVNLRTILLALTSMSVNLVGALTVITQVTKEQAFGGSFVGDRVTSGF